METTTKQNVFNQTSKRISTIFFDMDNTLIHTRKADVKACNKVSANCQVITQKNKSSFEWNDNIFSFPSSSPRSSPETRFIIRYFIFHVERFLVLFAYYFSFFFSFFSFLLVKITLHMEGCECVWNVVRLNLNSVWNWNCCFWNTNYFVYFLRICFNELRTFDAINEQKQHLHKTFSETVQSCCLFSSYVSYQHDQSFNFCYRNRSLCRYCVYSRRTLLIANHYSFFLFWESMKLTCCHDKMRNREIDDVIQIHFCSTKQWILFYSA